MIKYPWIITVACLAGMIDKQTQLAIAYLREENKILREKLGTKRLILNQFQKLRLAMKAKALDKHVLSDIATLFSPDTLLRWYRDMVARKYDGAANRNPKGGRPAVSQEIIELIVWFKRDNKGWGSRKIHGYLKYLGYWAHFPVYMTLISVEEYAAWLKDHGMDVLKNIDHLESLPPLEQKELAEPSKQRLFCRLCKCWIPAKVYVAGERCPKGKWLS